MKENGISLYDKNYIIFSPINEFYETYVYAFLRYLYDLITKRNLRFIIFEANGEQAVNVQFILVLVLRVLWLLDELSRWI